MRLLTHNLLCCVHCQQFPLDIECKELGSCDAVYTADFTRRMLARLEYPELVLAWQTLKAQVPHLANIPDIPANFDDVDASQDNSKDLKNIHYALCAVAVRNGSVSCPGCYTRFPIQEFIPNMMAAQGNNAAAAIANPDEAEDEDEDDDEE